MLTRGRSGMGRASKEGEMLLPPFEWVLPQEFLEAHVPSRGEVHWTAPAPGPRTKPDTNLPQERPAEWVAAVLDARAMAVSA